MSKINLHEMFEERMNEHANEHAPHFESMKWESYTLSHDYCMRQARSDFKSGYSAALNDLQPKVEALIQALEYYTLNTNYNIVNEGRNYQDDYRLYEVDENTYDDTEIGTVALKAIAEFKHAGER